MSNCKTTRISRAAVVLEVEHLRRLLRRGGPHRMKNRQAEKEEQHAWERAPLATDVDQEGEDTLHAAANAIVSEGKTAIFEHGTVAPQISDQILVRNEISGIPLHAEKAMTKMELETPWTQQKAVENRLLAVLESSIERFVRKVVRSVQTIAEVTRAGIDSSGFISPTDVLVRSEKRKCTEKIGKIEDHCRQYVKPRVKRDPVATSQLSNIGQNRPLISLTTPKQTRGRTLWRHRTAVAAITTEELCIRRILTNSDNQRVRQTSTNASSHRHIYPV